MTEQSAAETWLKATLAASAALTALLPSEASPSSYGKTIYVDDIPNIRLSDTNLPAVVIQHASGKDTMTQEKGRNMTEFLFIVKAVTAGTSKATAHAIALQIDTALQDIYASNSNSYQINCQRMMPYSLPVIQDGKRFNQVGGYYRVIVRPL